MAEENILDYDCRNVFPSLFNCYSIKVGGTIIILERDLCVERSFHSPSIYILLPQFSSKTINKRVLVRRTNQGIWSSLTPRTKPDMDFTLIQLTMRTTDIPPIQIINEPLNSDPVCTGSCVSYMDGYIFAFGGMYNMGTFNRHISYLNLDQTVLEWRKLNTINLQSGRYYMAGWPYEGKLYYFGGYGAYPLGGYDQSAYVEDEDSPFCWNNQLLAANVNLEENNVSWCLCKPVGAVPCPRAAHASCIKDNNVYIFGGRCKAYRLNDLYRLDMVNLIFYKIEADNRPCARSFATLTISDARPDELLVWGGRTNNERSYKNRYSTELHSFDLNKGKWTLLGDNYFDQREFATAEVTAENHLCMIGATTNAIPIQSKRIAPSSLRVIAFKALPRSVIQIASEISPHLHLQLKLREYFSRHCTVVCKCNVCKLPDDLTLKDIIRASNLLLY